MNKKAPKNRSSGLINILKLNCSDNFKINSFFHPDFNCRCRSFDDSSLKNFYCLPGIADFTADREFHPALKKFA